MERLDGDDEDEDGGQDQQGASTTARGTPTTWQEDIRLRELKKRKAADGRENGGGPEHGGATSRRSKASGCRTSRRTRQARQVELDDVEFKGRHSGSEMKVRHSHAPRRKANVSFMCECVHAHLHLHLNLNLQLHCARTQRNSQEGIPRSPPTVCLLVTVLLYDGRRWDWAP